MGFHREQALLPRLSRQIFAVNVIIYRTENIHKFAPISPSAMACRMAKGGPSAPSLATNLIAVSHSKRSGERQPGESGIVE
jgi:hypothetical protein